MSGGGCIWVALSTAAAGLALQHAQELPRGRELDPQLELRPPAPPDEPPLHGALLALALLLPEPPHPTREVAISPSSIVPSQGPFLPSVPLPLSTSPDRCVPTKARSLVLPPFLRSFVPDTPHPTLPSPFIRHTSLCPFPSLPTPAHEWTVEGDQLEEVVAQFEPEAAAPDPQHVVARLKQLEVRHTQRPGQLLPEGLE
ncbi:hypothetical protein FIBSPDRAFT_969229 [Athelia psychrophila]|uniref:Uncharacterized protein n=1 Tax=Athelia psychrophila TaxID=1759441 RepID=A0A167TR23_9AGAM|nr:hypothetical protein FIBSPDRAFT_969229 [Fibularhizoctonia sp. CBS 109695]